jgi:hypothetical protein
MPRKKRPPLGALPNVQRELVAQELADGRTQVVAFLAYDEPDLTLAERELKCRMDAKDGGPGHPTKLRMRAGKACRHVDVRDRVNTILAERHEQRLAIKADDVKISTHYVLDRLLDLVDRCMQAKPVTNGQGNSVGMWKFEPMAACKALELMGLEQGMFERQLKHVHAKHDPLDGNRDQIVGRLGVLLEQLSDSDLYVLGLQRLDVIEASSERVDDLGGEQEPAIQAISKTN